MRRSLFRIAAGLVPAFLCLAAVQAPAQTATVSSEVIDATPDCYRGTTIFKADAESHQACVDAAKADALERKASANYGARTNSTWSVTYTPPPPPPDVRTWVRVGPEKTSGGVIQSYTLTAPARVRFGVGQKWVEKAMPAGRFPCSTSTFGDPAPGSVKVCDREEVVPTTPVPTDPTPTPTDPTPQPGVGGVPKPSDSASYPASGPIVARAGQVIEKLRISSPTGNCILVPPGVTGVIVRDVEIGPCGSGTNQDANGVKVAPGAGDVAVLRSYIHDVSSCMYAEPTARHPLVFDRNYCTEIRGPDSRSEASRGQMVQINGVTGPAKGSRITCNVSDQTGPNHAVEDHINLFNSGGTADDPIEVAYNRLRGGHQRSNSGSGIMTGDGSLGGHLSIHDNVIVNVRNVGIGVAGGVDVRVFNNRIFMAMPASGFTNQGMYVWSQGGGTCSGHSFKNNRVYVEGIGGEGFWNGGNCGAYEFIGNVFRDRTLTASMFDEVPAQCQ